MKAKNARARTTITFVTKLLRYPPMRGAGNAVTLLALISLITEFEEMLPSADTLNSANFPRNF